MMTKIELLETIELLARIIIDTYKYGDTAPSNLEELECKLTKIEETLNALYSEPE
jgi:hypothetical protein